MYTAELASAVSNSYSPSPTVIPMQFVHDVKEWLSPVLHNHHGHSEPLHFRFTKDGDSTKFHYKRWTTEPWSEKGIVSLKVSLPWTFLNLKPDLTAYI